MGGPRIQIPGYAGDRLLHFRALGIRAIQVQPVRFTFSAALVLDGNNNEMLAKNGHVDDANFMDGGN